MKNYYFDTSKFFAPICRPVTLLWRLPCLSIMWWGGTESGLSYIHKCDLGSKVFEANMPYISGLACCLVVLFIPRLLLGLTLGFVLMVLNDSYSSIYHNNIHNGHSTTIQPPDDSKRKAMK